MSRILLDCVEIWPISTSWVPETTQLWKSTSDKIQKWSTAPKLDTFKSKFRRELFIFPLMLKVFSLNKREVEIFQIFDLYSEKKYLRTRMIAKLLL